MPQPVYGSSLMTEEFSLALTHDIALLKNAFQTNGRVDIRNFLGAGEAKTLRVHLQERADWTLVMNAGTGVYEVPRSGMAQLSQKQRDELDSRVIDAAQFGFQYRYESVRVPDEDADRQKRDTLLDRFTCFMSSDTVLNFLAEITGAKDLAFADGQATAYSTGHFLTSHDDDVEGKGRRAAYVLGLSPDWRAEWGGLLMFHGNDGNIQEAFVPAMAALRLFTVPCVHSVSYVTPFAPQPRLAVTGWLRSHR